MRLSSLSRGLLAAASLLLLATLATPLWRIRLVAPQYPEGLGMEIRAHTVHGEREHDLENINKLNHYIGMKVITAQAFPEFRVIPWVIGGLALFGLAAAAIGRRVVARVWLGAFLLSGLAGFAVFWRWTYAYGHDLDFEHAIIKVPGMTYQPPIFGTKHLLNFTAVSWPAFGGLLVGAAFALGVVALIAARRPVAVPTDG